jgi:hypothetical protein
MKRMNTNHDIYISEELRDLVGIRMTINYTIAG